jgi:GH35 family endo-1,4-beta-xylanase
MEEFRPEGAYLFGTDGIAIRKAEVKFENGLIECRKHNLGTAGLVLLWPIEGFGEVLLPTTCLPERTQPYILNVELARAKLMQIITKREDWSFFGNIEDYRDISAEIQDLFIHAIQNISDASVSSRLADESLRKATVFSEQLAIEQAEQIFDARSKGRGFGRGCLGCKIEAGQISNAQYIERLLELFGFVTIPINWSQIEPQRGNYDFSALDGCIKVLSRKKLALGAGPLLYFSKVFRPIWLLRGGAGFEKIREAAYKFILETVGRYSGAIRIWRVISGLNASNYFGFNFEQVLEMTRAASMAVKAVNERAMKIVEVSNPWGEYYAETPNTIPPLVYVDMVVQSGINFDAFGLQMRFGRNEPGMHQRDIMHISAILDSFGPVAKPLCITELEVPSESNGERPESKPGEEDKQQWSESKQRRWIEQFYKIAFSKQFVDAVTYSNLADTEDNTIAHSGLLTEKFEPKESFEGLKELHKVIFNR